MSNHWVQIKKAELHRHLDGSLRKSTMYELGKKFNVDIPADFHFSPNMTLEKALIFFDTSLKLLQEKSELTRVSAEICEDAKKDNITHLEIRFGPHLHLQKGLKIEQVVDSVLEGIDGRAGLILCGLYGDDPKLLKSYVEISKTRPGVVGIDLAGGPHHSQSFKLEDYQEAYTMALEIGLGRTVHASEGRNPNEIITAVNTLHATRLGHATTLLDSKEALDLVINKQITIESCPTSNLQCGVVTSLKEHPITKWLELGVKACINTDNTFFSNVTLSEEYQTVSELPGMTQELMNKSIENSFNAAFKLR
ncbi:MAG: hypothetical protein KC493_03875 [Bacteriovoracaceae bacterium]|nr:hypothetical protein [Bacteriovoracaceae bacterium]